MYIPTYTYTPMQYIMHRLCCQARAYEVQRVRTRRGEGPRRCRHAYV